MPGDALNLGLFALRTAFNASALLLIGLALHGTLSVVERDAFGRWHTLVVLLAVASIVLTFARLPLLNVQMGDAASLFDPDLTALSWLALGPSSLAFGAGAIAAVIGWVARSRWLLAGAAVVAAAGFALTGHTQGLPEPGLAPYAVAMHTAIAGFWVAAPLTLAPLVTTDDGILLARLKRFGAVAIIAIPLLFVAGLWLAWVLAGGLAGLFGSPYGRLLLLKFATGIAALGMGAINQRMVTAKVEADPATGRRWLNRTLAIETTLFVVAIVAVSAATTVAGPSE